MGCGCRKRKPRQAPEQQPGPAPQPQPQQPAQPAQSSRFELRIDSGQTSTYGSRLEAEAARVRRGNAGRIRPV